MGGEVFGPLMFAVVFLLIFLGYPVAFSLGGAAVIFGILGVAGGYFGPDYLQLLPERIFGIMSNPVLLAVPFFIFMGTVLEKSKLAEDLLHHHRTALFGRAAWRTRAGRGVRGCAARRGHRCGGGQRRWSRWASSRLPVMLPLRLLQVGWRAG